MKNLNYENEEMRDQDSTSWFQEARLIFMMRWHHDEFVIECLFWVWTFILKLQPDSFLFTLLQEDVQRHEPVAVTLKRFFSVETRLGAVS